MFLHWSMPVHLSTLKCQVLFASTVFLHCDLDMHRHPQIDGCKSDCLYSLQTSSAAHNFGSFREVYE